MLLCCLNAFLDLIWSLGIVQIDTCYIANLSTLWCRQFFTKQFSWRFHFNSFLFTNIRFLRLAIHLCKRKKKIWLFVQFFFFHMPWRRTRYVKREACLNRRSSEWYQQRSFFCLVTEALCRLISTEYWKDIFVEKTGLELFQK